MNQVVLIYSGGLDTSVCIPMMKEDYGFDHIVTVTVDVGQPEEDIRTAAEKAKALGTEHYTVDAKDEFARDYCFPAIQANALYQGGYPVSTSIARPLIALKAVEIAQQKGALAFAHGCTGKGNDQLRIEFIVRTLLPDARIIAPMREKNMTRTEEIEYARLKNVPIGQSAEKIWSIDENLWGRSIEGGRLEEPDFAPPEEIFQWTVSPQAAPDEPTYLTIGFENGNPVSMNGEALAPLALIQMAHQLAGANGIGRIDIMEDRMLGLKVRENYECPAPTVLYPAHAALEALVFTKEERAFKKLVDAQWADLAYAGLWLDPLKADLDAFIAKTQERVTGEVIVRLYKGSVTVVGRRSPFALYSEDLASFDSKTWDQRDGEALCKAYGMQARMAVQIAGK
ncbi:MAG TPA: argininosuccinate synthase [Armatimonadota bacterium]